MTRDCSIGHVGSATQWYTATAMPKKIEQCESWRRQPVVSDDDHTDTSMRDAAGGLGFKTPNRDFA